MKEIEEDHDLQLQLIVTGMHLSPEFGMTVNQIEQDGFSISKKVEMLLSSDSGVAMSKSVGLGCIGFADAYEDLQPDIVVLLGDRFEILAAATAAMLQRIPIAHIHGGESTEGAVDEAIRHAVSKMAHLHFVAAEPYRRRVIQLGEQPERVFNVGAPGLDYISRAQLLDREAFEESIQFELGSVNFLITYHPETLSEADALHAIQQLLTALQHFPQAKLIFTAANADINGRAINQALANYVEQQTQRCALFPSLGQIRYLSALRHVDVVIGNSSSGIIEVPVFHKPTVNIGDRQAGRLQASSIINCRAEVTEIVQAIEQALSPDFQQSLDSVQSLYGDGRAATKMVHMLKTTNLHQLVRKRFYDLLD
jgi:UDP-N-acetylglucosamine 2-epimerase (non-hydrolysing)/GDP/UDP-N,N'-diacetylbacillosamine 2-epimerase (hydrolysing)